MDTEKPLAFISHAGEDKNRFVIAFANRLLENGIDVWVDKWEMLPGDSLIEKIFDEGIKNATAFIIVLSKNSVQKRWVKEELNAGLIKRLSGKTKVIPVVIDECDIPEALKTIVWERITNLESYEEELQRIVAAVHGASLKPAVGPSPKYIQINIDNLPGFSKIDLLVLKASCEYSIETDRSYIDTPNLKEKLIINGITQDQIYESLEILEEKSFIEAEHEVASNGINFYKITTYGFVNYAKIFLKDFDYQVSQVLVALVNGTLSTNDEISIGFKIPKMLANYILDILENIGYIQLIKTISGKMDVIDISASGKRAARNMQN